MILRKDNGQALVESLLSLGLLLMVFFFTFYIFLLGIYKIRSLDTVYHLARVQEVRSNQNLTARFIPVVAQCFGMHPYLTQTDSQPSAGPAISQVTFKYYPTFTPSLLPRAHKSVMRVVQPNSLYLAKSYPTAPEDSVGLGLEATLEKEKLIVFALAQANADSVTDLLRDLESGEEEP